MAEDGRRYSAAPKQKAPETILLEAWTEGKRVGSGFLGGAPLEWLVEDNNCDGPSPIEGYDMREWRRVMLETSRGWPATAPCMPHVWAVQGNGYALFKICAAAQACVQWSSFGVLEPWMLSRLRDALHAMTLTTESRTRIVLMMRPWLEAQGGRYPEALCKKQIDNLLLRFYELNKLLENAPSKVVNGKNDALVARLNSQLQATAMLQADCHRIELEELIFEIRRVSTSTDYKHVLGQAYMREVVRMPGYIRAAWGLTASTMESLSSAELKQWLRQGDLPPAISERLVKSGIKHYRRTFQQPLQDVINGYQSPGAFTRCCLFLGC